MAEQESVRASPPNIQDIMAEEPTSVDSIHSDWELPLSMQASSSQVSSQERSQDNAPSVDEILTGINDKSKFEISNTSLVVNHNLNK